MRKVFRWAFYLVLFLLGWRFLLWEKYIVLDPPYRGVVEILPLYALIAFGCYSLAVISLNLMTFNECVSDARSLEKERKMAIEDLKKKGIDIRE